MQLAPGILAVAAVILGFVSRDVASPVVLYTSSDGPLARASGSISGMRFRPDSPTPHLTGVRKLSRGGGRPCEGEGRGPVAAQRALATS